MNWFVKLGMAALLTAFIVGWVYIHVNSPETLNSGFDQEIPLSMHSEAKVPATLTTTRATVTEAQGNHHAVKYARLSNLYKLERNRYL